MSRTGHIIYIGIFVVIIAAILIMLIYNGFSYYRVSLEERFFHADHTMLKSSGETGHGLGIIGAFCIVTGVGTYMARKRYRSLTRFGLLKYWLEFHIFLCILGTFLVIFHSTFKAEGIAAISFWSMITVFLSGFAGRVIYLQIPRTLEGRELDLRELRGLRSEVMEKINNEMNLGEEILKQISVSVENRSELYTPSMFPSLFRKLREERSAIRTVHNILKKNKISGSRSSGIMSLVKNDIRLGRTIERLEFMKNLFRYWHIFHLPFAVLMFLFMILHVIVTIVLGYKWIF